MNTIRKITHILDKVKTIDSSTHWVVTTTKDERKGTIIYRYKGYKMKIQARIKQLPMNTFYTTTCTNKIFSLPN